MWHGLVSWNLLVRSFPVGCFQVCQFPCMFSCRPRSVLKKALSLTCQVLYFTRLHSTKACTGSQCQPSVHSFCRRHRNCVLHLVFPLLAFFFLLSCFFSCCQQVPRLTDVVKRISRLSVAKEFSLGRCDWKEFTWLLKIWPNCFFCDQQATPPCTAFSSARHMFLVISSVVSFKWNCGTQNKVSQCRLFLPAFVLHKCF